jgi:bacterioferritin
MLGDKGSSRRHTARLRKNGTISNIVRSPVIGAYPTKDDPKVIDYLNQALRHELTAVNQYWLHYRLLDNWGYKALAKQWRRKESIEEMQHADKLIERIIFLDGFANMQTLESIHIG